MDRTAAHRKFRCTWSWEGKRLEGSASWGSCQLVTCRRKVCVLPQTAICWHQVIFRIWMDVAVHSEAGCFIARSYVLQLPFDGLAAWKKKSAQSMEDLGFERDLLQDRSQWARGGRPSSLGFISFIGHLLSHTLELRYRAWSSWRWSESRRSFVTTSASPIIGKLEKV